MDSAEHRLLIQKQAWRRDCDLVIFDELQKELSTIGEHAKETKSARWPSKSPERSSMDRAGSPR